MHLPSKLVIKQKVEPMEIFTGFETCNRYQILDTDGNERFYAYEEGSFFARNILGTRRPMTIKVIDKDKNEILSITRDWFLLRAGYRVTGKTDGAIVQKRWFLKKSFEILKDKHKILHCTNSIPHLWTFRILESKQEIGRITKKWSGASEIFSDADNFLVDFGSIRKEYRLMVLATALAIDTRVFESKK
ncbi:MAG: phospholipid scramblase-related protein [Candidatus Woesearchaeota archaeon]